MHPDVPIKRVLIPIDFSDGARRAFYAGLGLAARYGAETWVLHVVEPVRAFDYGRKKYVETKETIERVEDGVKRRIDELYQEGGTAAVDRRRVHVLVLGGKPAQLIVETAADKQIDMIVMGHSDDVGVEALLGTNAERVLRNAGCSVLVVRGKDEA